MVKIIGDTTSGIPIPTAASLDLPLLPQIIIFGQESFRDDTELDSPTFIKKLKASDSLPKTAAPPPALYNPYLEKARHELDEVIIICPSAELSGTVRSATSAAAEFNDIPIKIIDSKTIGAGLATLVLQAKQWADEGVSGSKIIKRLDYMIQNEQNYFVVDTLEYLYKGGRIGGAQNLFGSMLQIKPILTLTDGKVQPVESQRTKKRAHARLLELVDADFPGKDSGFLCVMHGDALEDAQAIAAQFKEKYHLSEVPIYDLPPAFLVHAGPGVLGVSFFKA